MKVYVTYGDDLIMGIVLLGASTINPKEVRSHEYVEECEFDISTISDHDLISELCNRFDLCASKDSTGCITIAEDPIGRDSQKEPVSFGRHIVIFNNIKQGIDGDINNGIA